MAAEQAPLNERLAEIRRIIRLTPEDDKHAARLLVQLAKSMLSEAELSGLPESERLHLYEGIQGAIARLKPAISRLAPTGAEEDLESWDTEGEAELGSAAFNPADLN